MYKLISATPSPYARKVRIVLAEKGVPFELITEVPWDATTRTPDFNPLEKLPILLRDDGDPIFESNLILAYLERAHPEPPLVPKDDAGWLLTKRFEVLCDGVCDAFVLLFFERQRDADKQSVQWMTRQQRKIEGGLAELERRLGEQAYAVDNRFTLADIVVATATGYLSVRWPEFDTRERYPVLAAHHDRMAERASFQNSQPVPQTITDRVV